MGKTNKESEFLAKFPLGKVPAFESADGLKLWGSDAIAQYVAESGPAATQLLGADTAQRAVIRQWVDFAEGEIMASLVPLLLWRVKLTQYNETIERISLQNVERCLATLEQHLKGRTWIATEDKLSLADISVISAVYWGFSRIIDAEMREKYPTFVAWYNKATEAEEIKHIYAEKSFIEKREAYQG
ncbi:hypothetical protein ASPWEDRAFT_39806 [Aspergillus wentii DTO 134E9]|uniref:GST C-terminal domain-containing protein n=1 Tax=Aspergillus wentii DTO 134E9 TaxID=1073089 RepID=A0A1L9RIH8_ASPWE|nr:uncharacterized protein ASPWEDRAFT_39806 [Aspergillus wentii DTO 134E9]OJJ34724.1 hypothetical protein ASPWEDRAFT_39806 [Aspergillus wentii DTO 134E9]